VFTKYCGLERQVEPHVTFLIMIVEKTMSKKDNEATYKHQVATYGAVMKGIKWSSVGLAVLMVILYIWVKP
jgi:hypothetical protein